MTDSLVLTEFPARGRAGVALVTLNRPQALNALSFALMDALVAALGPLDADQVVSAPPGAATAPNVPRLRTALPFTAFAGDAATARFAASKATARY